MTYMIGNTMRTNETPSTCDIEAKIQGGFGNLGGPKLGPGFGNDQLYDVHICGVHAHMVRVSVHKRREV